jgi:hypothetical protein
MAAMQSNPFMIDVPTSVLDDLRSTTERRAAEPRLS